MAAAAISYPRFLHIINSLPSITEAEFMTQVLTRPLSNLTTYHPAFIINNEYAHQIKHSRETIDNRENALDFEFKFYIQLGNESKKYVKQMNAVIALRYTIRNQKTLYFIDEPTTSLYKIIDIRKRNDSIYYPELPPLSSQSKIAPDFNFKITLENLLNELVESPGENNLLIDGENILKGIQSNEWIVNSGLPLSNVFFNNPYNSGLNDKINKQPLDVIHEMVKNIHSTHNQSTHNITKYICVIPRYRLKEHYRHTTVKYEFDADLEKRLIIIEKKGTVGQPCVYFISMSEQSQIDQLKSISGDYTPPASNYPVAIPPVIQNIKTLHRNYKGTESDDLLLIYILLKCGGNILSFDNYNWFSGAIINDGSNRHFFLNNTNPPNPFMNLFKLHRQTGHRTIDFSNLFLPGIPEGFVSIPSGVAPTTNVASTNINIIENIVIRETALQAAAAASPEPPARLPRTSGGSKKRKTIKKMTHKKRNKKVTQNKKKKLTRKMRK
jgi:hypothetical protein